MAQATALILDFTEAGGYCGAAGRPLLKILRTTKAQVLQAIGFLLSATAQATLNVGTGVIPSLPLGSSERRGRSGTGWHGIRARK